MLASYDLIAFIATAHPEQARAFYSEVLGLPLREESPFALVFDAHGTMLRIQKVNRLTNVDYTVLGWQVHDLLEAVEHWEQRGINQLLAVGDQVTAGRTEKDAAMCARLAWAAALHVLPNLSARSAASK